METLSKQDHEKSPQQAPNSIQWIHGNPNLKIEAENSGKNREVAITQIQGSPKPSIKIVNSGISHGESPTIQKTVPIQSLPGISALLHSKPKSVPSIPLNVQRISITPPKQQVVINKVPPKVDDFIEEEVVEESGNL